MTAALATLSAPAQIGSDDVVEGTVLNAATNQPVGRALVSSTDDRYAAFTDDRGHFEFKVPRSPDSAQNREQETASLRPTALVARHPGFLETGDSPPVPVADDTHHVTIHLVPEARIVGEVELPSSEPRPRLRVSLYKKEVNDGRGVWRFLRQASTRNNGQFRFAELAAGSYRVFTNEELDRDPEDMIPGGPLYGYPPVYYPAATDFEASSILTLLPGQSAETALKLTRQKYLPVAIPVENAIHPFEVRVRRNGSNSPGYELGFSPRSHQIEGLLPEGSYKVEAFTYSDPKLYGAVRLTISSAGTHSPSLVLLPATSIPVDVKEEFRNKENRTIVSAITRRRPGTLPSMANVVLVPADESDSVPFMLQNPQKPGEPLVIDGVRPGTYWVHVSPFRGFAATVTSGGVDLTRERLVVGAGSSVPTIEITLRDVTARLRGVIEGSRADVSVRATNSTTESARIYCVPLPDSTGQFAEVPVSATGAFEVPSLVPGVYRIMAFKTPPTDMEYRNAEAMRAYESKGVVLRLVEDQDESIRLPLVSEEP